MKKLLALLTLFCMVLSMAACGGNETTKANDEGTVTTNEQQKPTVPAPIEKTEIRFAVLSGPTGIGASKLIADAKADKTANKYQIEIQNDPKAVIAGFKKGNYDLAALPVNVASVLYNTQNANVEVVALNTLGVLYVLEKDSNTVKTVADLKGKTVMTIGEGATPQYILEYVLAKNNLTAGKDVNVKYYATADEVVANIQTTENAVVMLPEPKATVVSKQMPNVKYALNMTEEWDKVSDTKLAQGCVVATKAFIKDHKDALNAFLDEYKASIDTVNKADDAAAQLVVDAGLIGKAPIAKIAIPKCNVVFMEGDELKAVMNGTLSVLFEKNPASIGGKLPQDDFYYKR